LTAGMTRAAPPGRVNTVIYTIGEKGPQVPWRA
jgi:hypothetical protein